MSKHIYSFVLFFVITTLSSYAQIVIFDDDFEDTTLGAAVTATLNSGISTGSWVGGNIETDRLNISDDVVSAGNRALTFSDVNAWSDSAYAQAHMSADTALSSGIDITFRGTTDSANKRPSAGRVSGYDDSNNELFRMVFTQDGDEPNYLAETFGAYYFADIAYYNGTTEIQIANNVWFRYEGGSGGSIQWFNFEINLDADGVDIWVDADEDGEKDAGEYVEDVAYLNGQTGTDKLDYLKFCGDGTNEKAEKNYYDDILVVFPPPPPGSVFMIH